jgi:hypothetical protein
MPISCKNQPLKKIRCIIIKMQADGCGMNEYIKITMTY